MFKQKRHKSFSYKPRFKDSKKEINEDVKTKWNAIKASSKKRNNFFTTLPALIIMLIVLLIIMYILESYIK